MSNAVGDKLPLHRAAVERAAHGGPASTEGSCHAIGSTTRSAKADLSAVRQWARANGHEVLIAVGSALTGRAYEAAT
jgi:hypothetical protein